MHSIPSAVVDEVMTYILPHIKQYLRCREATKEVSGPFVLGITGTQGSGKSTWARCLSKGLGEAQNLKVINLSLDDLYFDHATLVRIRESDPKNGLLQTRGHAGTHDEQLAKEFFQSLRNGSMEISIPCFDKSKFGGEGDRVPKSEWNKVPGKPPIDVVIFEGWCLGFRPLSDEKLQEKWDLARAEEERDKSSGEDKLGYSTTTLANHSLEHLRTVNRNLARYCETFTGPSSFDYFIHLDTNQLVNVYEWRVEQEHALKHERGVGMTDEQVVRFVQGYMPGYELYLEQLRKDPFVKTRPKSDWKGQLRVVLNKKREIIEIRRV